MPFLLYLLLQIAQLLLVSIAIPSQIIVLLLEVAQFVHLLVQQVLQFSDLSLVLHALPSLHINLIF